MQSETKPDDALPDKPPPTSGGCCTKIATFLSLGPRVGIELALGSVKLGLALYLGRAERPRA